MFHKVEGPECPKCGSQDGERSSGRIVCADCGESFNDPDCAYVFVQRTRCPVCESVNVKTVRSEQNGDDTVTRRSRCRDCGHRFKTVVE